MESFLQLWSVRNVHCLIIMNCFPVPQERLEVFSECLIFIQSLDRILWQGWSLLYPSYLKDNTLCLKVFVISRRLIVKNCLYPSKYQNYLSLQLSAYTDLNATPLLPSLLLLFQIITGKDLKFFPVCKCTMLFSGFLQTFQHNALSYSQTIFQTLFCCVPYLQGRYVRIVCN